MRFFITFLLCSCLSLALTSCEHFTEPLTSLYTDCTDRNSADVLADTECALVSAPLNYNNSNSEVISLFVRKFPAREHSRGEIFMLAGGPGESGASFYADIEFFRNVFSNYDLVLPDHRGTGYSTKLCQPEETSDSAGGLALVGQEWGTCFEKLYSASDRAHSFNLTAAAHDVETLIAHLGSNKKTYIYGVSYGTALAIAVAERTGARLDGIILDSLTPSPSDNLNDLSHRSQTTNKIGTIVLDRCSNEPSCPLGKQAMQAYAALLTRLDTDESIVGMEAIPNGDLKQFLGLLLDVPASRRQIPNIIADMTKNEQTATDLINQATKDYEAFWAPILAFEQATLSIPLSGLVSGSEFNRRKNLSPELVAREKSELGFTSPLPGLLANNNFPLYQPPLVTSSRQDLPPMLILQGTLDPKTPYSAAIEYIEKLETLTQISVITLLDAPHAAYFTSKDCLSGPLGNFVKRPQLNQSTECTPSKARLFRPEPNTFKDNPPANN